MSYFESVAGEPALVREDGSFDLPAIKAEIERRCNGQWIRIGWPDQEFHTLQVWTAARRQRWPFVEAAIAAERTPAERTRANELSKIARPGGIASISTSASRAAVELDRLRQTVAARGLARFQAREDK
jgi:hypothetical protein